MPAAGASRRSFENDSDTARPAGTRPSKRRATDSQYQRTEHSCDRCRQRKRRCLRPDDDAPCMGCDEAGAECLTTMPRKQRVYTTVDQLSVRYRLLDSLVRGLFPDQEVDSIEGLLALAEYKGVPMPQVDDVVPLNPTRRASAPVEPVQQQPVSSGTHNETIPEGWLLPAPNGGYHYVGTASLVYFAHSARCLVSKSNLATSPSYDEVGLRNYLRAAEFTTYKVSHAIEDGKNGNPLAQDDDADPAPAMPSHDAARQPRSNAFDRLVDVLPDRATADLLVQSFFDHAHLSFPIFHRGAFQIRYTSTWPPNRDQQRLFKHDSGWMSCLLMVFILGAQKLEADLGGQPQALHQKCLSIFLHDGLERIILSSTLSNVQALMLLSLYQHNMGERNSAWLLIGHAARSAVALGMHRDGGEDSKFDPFERNTRRLVWSTLYAFEQTMSLALGRPSFTETVNATASLPDATFTSSIGLPAGLLEHAEPIARLHSKVRRFVGTLSPNYEVPGKLDAACSVANDILNELSAWRARLPQHLLPSSPLPARRPILLLHIWSYYLESIVTRPFILGRGFNDIPSDAPSQPLSSAAMQLADRCVHAAHASVRLLLDLESSGLLEGCVSLDFYAIYHATIIIGLHFLGRPDSTDDIKSTLATLLARVKGVTLAPTFRILMNIAMPLAYIANVTPETTLDLPTPAAATSTSFSSEFLSAGTPAMAPLSSHHPFPEQNPVPDAPDPMNVPGAFNPRASGDDSEQLQLSALERLFGPMPQLQHTDVPLDVFADLYAVDMANDVEPRAFAM